MLKRSIFYIILIAFFFSPNVKGEKDKSNEHRKFDYFFYEGLKLKQAGKYDAAYDVFTHCLAIDSTAAPVLYELSSFYLQLRHTNKALEMLKRAVAADKTNFTYRMILASTYRNIGMNEEAAAEFEQLVESYPDKTDLNYYLAEVLTRSGNIEKAIKAYDALELSIGMSEGLSMQKYSLYSSLKKPDEAFAEMEKLAAKYPMEPRYQMVLGDLSLENGDAGKAYDYYQKAQEIDPGNPYYIVSMANYYEVIGDKDASEEQINSALVNERLDVETKVRILSRYTQKQLNENDTTGRAEALFEILIKQHPEDMDIRNIYAQLLLSKDKEDDAKLLFQQITETEPENDEAWEQLLRIALKGNDIQEVKRICSICIETFPDVPEYYFYMGLAYIIEKEYQQALDVYITGLEIIPDKSIVLKSNFYGQIGDIHHQMGNQAEAFKAYDEALKYNDKNVFVLNNYSYFLALAKQDLKRAERMSAQCIKLEPNNATYLDTYAWIFFMQGNYSLAKIYIESAISKDTTNNTELINHYGDILYMQGEKEKAVEQWKKAKELGMESEVLDKKIAEETYFEDNEAR